MIRALRQLVLTWGALVLPLFVCAHNGEVLLARLTMHADGACSLKVTADLEANFNIRERAELAKVAEGLFAISTGKDLFPLTQAAGSPDFSSSTKLETADLTLLSGGLATVPRAITLARATMQNVRQNLLLAFLYNILAIPVAAGVLYPLLGHVTSPMLAAAAMSLSSLSVIANALRLRSIDLSGSVPADGAAA